MVLSQRQTLIGPWCDLMCVCGFVCVCVRLDLCQEVQLPVDISCWNPELDTSLTPTKLCCGTKRYTQPCVCVCVSKPGSGGQHGWKPDHPWIFLMSLMSGRVPAAPCIWMVFTTMSPTRDTLRFKKTEETKSACDRLFLTPTLRLVPCVDESLWAVQNLKIWSDEHWKCDSGLL